MIETIRNFVIIAHIDHGKSTLADRFLELTKTIDKRQMRPQYLDQMEIEREKGITIKMAPVRMSYVLNLQPYILNLIDTPGHSDFSYEVSRALQSVEGAILLVDITQGIQAQTLVNYQLAKKAGLKIIGAVTKIDAIDFNAENAKQVIKETANLIGVGEKEIFKVSGKTGEGVMELLEAVIKQVPKPKDGTSNAPQALIFDSFYDDHKGVIAFVRVFEGEYAETQETRLSAINFNFKIKEVGYFVPQLKPVDKLLKGEIGYIATGIKDPEKLRIGDTIGDKALAGYAEPQPVVFVSLYPDDPDRYEDFKYALLKLKLNDSSLTFEPDMNEVLGRGFKCGFLGQLHFEITAERLEREFKIKTISTFPFVAYKIKSGAGDYKIIKKIEEVKDNAEVLEPTIKLSILVPLSYLGNVLQLKDRFFIKEIKTDNFENKILITAKMPLASLLSDFDGELKSVSHGLASFSYSFDDYEKSDLVRVEILIAGETVAGLTRLIYRNEVEHECRKMLLKLKSILPRQQFVQSLQAKAESRIVVRENIPAQRKDVTGYLYGGDRTRKMKLWKKQQRGKKKLKEMARVRISADVFKELLKK